MLAGRLRNGLFWACLFFVGCGVFTAQGEGLVRDDYPGSPFGINNPYNDDGVSIGPWLDDIGIHWTKSALFRRIIEPEKGVYEWKKTDRKVDAMFNGGKTHIIGVVNPFSSWDVAGGLVIKGGGRLQKGHYYVSDWQAYERYVSALVDRYKQKIKYWMVFNEPETEYLSKPQEYIKLLKTTVAVVKKIDPEAKIVLAAASGNLEFLPLWDGLLKDLSGYKKEEGYFDIFDIHTYPNARESVEDIYNPYILLLRKHGFSQKPVWSCEGGTHSGGYEKLHKFGAQVPLQSEREQAFFLVQRFFSAVALGVQKVYWSSLREHEEFGGTIHNHFTLVGLIYNGVPTATECQKQLPCPDPGDGIKKLSYYTYKFLVEKFEGCDWKSIKVVSNVPKGVHLVEVEKQGKPVYAIWLDPDRASAPQPFPVVLSVEKAAGLRASLASAVPKASSGVELKAGDYPRFFPAREVDASQGQLSMMLSDSPEYIEGVRIQNVTQQMIGDK